jgi:hypothetical protein
VPGFHAWTEFGPDGIQIARAVTPEDRCPAFETDGKLVPMVLRAAPAPGFSVRVCELVVPVGTHTARIHDGFGFRALPLSLKKPKRIVVIGDTGCRIKWKEGHGVIQDCNDPDEWPFLKVAAAAAKFHPDLVIHVGDYLYRETPCPKDPQGQELKKCAGTPFGYGGDVWEADFFRPADKLLQSAPWVFVRGNHELCSRAGEGWFRYLDPRVYSGTCSDRTEAYRVPIGDLRMGVLDSSDAADRKAGSQDVLYYQNQLGVLESGGSSKWILTHRPFWALYATPSGQPGKMNVTLQDAARRNGMMMKGQPVELVLAGHIHLFEALSFQDPGPSQLVLGNGGTELNPPVPKSAKPFYRDLPIDARKVKEATILKSFGFLTLEEERNGSWNAISHAADGRTIDRFRIRKNVLQKVR